MENPEYKFINNYNSNKSNGLLININQKKYLTSNSLRDNFKLSLRKNKSIQNLYNNKINHDINLTNLVLETIVYLRSQLNINDLIYRKDDLNILYDDFNNNTKLGDKFNYFNKYNLLSINKEIFINYFNLVIFCFNSKNIEYIKFCIYNIHENLSYIAILITIASINKTHFNSENIFNFLRSIKFNVVIHILKYIFVIFNEKDCLKLQELILKNLKLGYNLLVLLSLILNQIHINDCDLLIILYKSKLFINLINVFQKVIIQKRPDLYVVVADLFNLTLNNTESILKLLIYPINDNYLIESYNTTYNENNLSIIINHYNISNYNNYCISQILNNNGLGVIIFNSLIDYLEYNFKNKNSYSAIYKSLICYNSFLELLLYFDLDTNIFNKIDINLKLHQISFIAYNYIKEDIVFVSLVFNYFFLLNKFNLGKLGKIINMFDKNYKNLCFVKLLNLAVIDPIKINKILNYEKEKSDIIIQSFKLIYYVLYNNNKLNNILNEYYAVDCINKLFNFESSLNNETNLFNTFLNNNIDLIINLIDLLFLNNCKDLIQILPYFLDDVFSYFNKSNNMICLKSCEVQKFLLSIIESLIYSVKNKNINDNIHTISNNNNMHNILISDELSIIIINSILEYQIIEKMIKVIKEKESNIVHNTFYYLINKIFILFNEKYVQQNKIYKIYIINLIESLEDLCIKNNSNDNLVNLLDKIKSNYKNKYVI